jgi:hypothetical protein
MTQLEFEKKIKDIMKVSVPSIANIDYTYLKRVRNDVLKDPPSVVKKLSKLLNILKVLLTEVNVRIRFLLSLSFAAKGIY